MGKKAMASILAVILMIQSLGVFHVSGAQSSTGALEYGDYFILGRYLGEEIVWRNVGSNGYGDVALSFKVLTSKAYNSQGLKPENHSVPDRLRIPQEVDPTGDRARYGSNIWVSSTLRAWLNSDGFSGQVGYIGNPPSSGSVTANPYDGEPGFLSNFTPMERAAMKPTLHAAALSEVDYSLKTAGTQVPGWDNGASLTDPLRHLVTDTIFLPDANLLSNIARDSQLDWRVGYWSTGFHRAGITDGAINSASSAQRPDGEYRAVDYWTGTPMGSQWGGTHQMQIRLVGGGHSFVNVNEGVMGVRPAFYINHDSIAITGGSGTQEDPYTIGVFDGSFGVTLKGGNEEKLYAPDKDILQISASQVPNLTLSYITVDPEIQLNINNEAAFNNHNPTPLSHTSGKAALTVEKNCTIYVMAKGTVGGSVKTAFGSITYNNFYQPVRLYQVGETPEGDYLYRETLIEGLYGVPVNTFSNSVLNGVVYDEVDVPEALPSKLSAFWKRASGSVSQVTLNDIKYFDNPQTITNLYQKISDKWVTVDFYFANQNGTKINVEGVSQQPLTKTKWVPQGMKMSQIGAYFHIPGAVDSNLTPYKWGMYDAGNNALIGNEFYEKDDAESVGFDPQMPDNETHVAIWIYYKSGQYKVTENFVEEGTGKLLKTNMVSIEANGEYNRGMPPEIDHYVAVGYEIGGGGRIDLTMDPEGRPQWNAISKTITRDLNVTFFYAADTDADGIPDNRQVQVTTRWIGVYPDDRPNVPLKPDVTQRVLKGEPITITNDGYSGNDDHTISALGANWVFDPAAGGNSRQIMPVAETAIRFYYNVDSGGTGAPDLEHGVTVKHAVFNGSVLSYPAEWTDKFVNIVQGGTYTGAAPYRGGYVAVGWLLDSDDYGDLMGFGGYDSNQAKFTTEKTMHTVTFVYRAAAEPVTIHWVGTALTGAEIEFGSVTVTGYDGESFDIDIDKLRASVSVDGDSWTWNQQASTVPSSIAFSQSPQRFVFHYDEVEEFYYSIHYVSTGGKTLFEVKIPAKNTDHGFTIKPKEFPLYGYLGYEIFEFGNLFSSGTEKSITLTPSEGAMSVYFYYEPLTADVIVKGAEHGTGELLHTEIYPDEFIGSEFSVSSPYIEGWSLSAGEEKIKSVTVAAGGSTIVFEYTQNSGNVQLLLKEGDTNGRIITSEEHTLLQGVPTDIPVPDLSHMYYTALSEPETVTYTGDDITIEYYYERDIVQVIKRTYNPEGRGYVIAEFDMGMYRAGEIARFYAPGKDEYALDDEALKLVRINPIPPHARAVYYQEVPFYYSVIAGSGRLVVEAVNQSGSILLSYNIPGDEGKEITVNAPVVQGYRLVPGQSGSQTGKVSGKVSFVYQRQSDSDYADLTVTVQSSEGAVLKDAYVTAKSGGMKIRSSTTGADGKTLLSDLPSGEYSVSATCSGYYDGTLPVTLDGDKSLVITLVKPAAGDGSQTPPGGGTNGSTQPGPSTPGPAQPGPSTPGPARPNPSTPGPARPNPSTPGTAQPGPVNPGTTAPGDLLEVTERIPFIFGFGDGTVRPDAYITRSEAAMIFYRLLREPHESGDVAFSDVEEGKWYTDAVNTLSALGIVKGYLNGEFRPDRTITRAEFTAIVSRFDELEKTYENHFNDVEPGHWAESYINSAYMKGWVNGYPGGEFRQDNLITRAEVVTLVNRVLGRAADGEEIPEESIYSDLPRNHWAYEDFWEASR